MTFCEYIFQNKSNKYAFNLKQQICFFFVFIGLFTLNIILHLNHSPNREVHLIFTLVSDMPVTQPHHFNGTNIN